MELQLLQEELPEIMLHPVLSMDPIKNDIIIRSRNGNITHHYIYHLDGENAGTYEKRHGTFELDDTKEAYFFTETEIYYKITSTHWVAMNLAPHVGFNSHFGCIQFSNKWVRFLIIFGPFYSDRPRWYSYEPDTILILDMYTHAYYYSTMEPSLDVSFAYCSPIIEHRACNLKSNINWLLFCGYVRNELGDDMYTMVPKYIMESIMRYYSFEYIHLFGGEESKSKHLSIKLNDIISAEKMELCMKGVVNEHYKAIHDDVVQQTRSEIEVNTNAFIYNPLESTPSF